MEAAACQMNPLIGLVSKILEKSLLNFLEKTSQVNLQEEIKEFYIRSPPVVVNFCRGECIDYSSFCKSS